MPRWTKPRDIVVNGDEATIVLTRGYTTVIDKQDINKVSAHNWSATINAAGQVYASRSYKVGKKSYRTYLHRVILDAPDSSVVDHIDLDTLNNRQSNLRLATVAQNAVNCRAKVSNPTGLKGAFYMNRKSPNAKNWFSSIRKDGRDIYLGTFWTAEEAHAAYAKAASELHGEFARVV